MKLCLLDGSMCVCDAKVNQARVLAELQALPGSTATLPLSSSEMLIWCNKLEISSGTQEDIVTGLKVCGVKKAVTVHVVSRSTASSSR